MNKKTFFANVASKALALAAAVMMMSAAFTACSKDNDATKHNTGKYVDLGLPSGLKWAKCNLGASKPSDYGNYYAWGELIDKCTWTWTTQDGVKGYEVKGPNGNPIVLPVAGNWGSKLDHAGVYGYYRSSSLSTGNSNYARGLYFNSSKRGLDIFGRCYGFTVRPVRP